MRGIGEGMGGLIENGVTISFIDCDVGIVCGYGTGDISDGSHDECSTNSICVIY